MTADPGDTTQAIARAMSAGPADVVESARIVDTDAQGNTVVLRKGAWMIMWPFDPKTTGLPTTHKPSGSYIMWAGSPYAHVHVWDTPEDSLNLLCKKSRQE
jgi:hypothetical protein